MSTQAIERGTTRNARVGEQAPALMPGYEAQGYALAQSVAGMVMNHARDLRRAITTAFELTPEARKSAMKYITQWQKQCVINAKANENIEGITPKEWGRMARTATTQCSQFNVILKAMNAGMSVDTLSETGRVDDPENIGFNTILMVARKFNESIGAGTNRGRPGDDFSTKLAKWLARQEVHGKDAKVKKQVESVLVEAHLLPEDVEVSKNKKRQPKHETTQGEQHHEQPAA